MAVTYNIRVIPLTGNFAPKAGIPNFRITSIVNGSTVVCLSGEKEGNDPWEDNERTTSEGDGTTDTVITIERINNVSPFVNDGKVVIVHGTNLNQFAHHTYRWLNNTRELTGKSFLF